MVVLGSKQTKRNQYAVTHLAHQKRGCPRNPQAVAESDVGLPRRLKRVTANRKQSTFAEAQHVAVPFH
jgi:hypothetical protein